MPIGPYFGKNERRIFYEQHLEKVRALPGVTHAGLSESLPFTFQGSSRHFEIEGRPVLRSDPRVHTRSVMPGYHETMGEELLSGRFFTEKDNLEGGEQTVIVNETFANRFWTVETSVGKRIRPRGSKDWMRVIGVTKDVTNYSLDQRKQPSVYLPYLRDSNFNMYGIVHTSGDPLSLVAPIRQIVQSVDSGVPIDDVQIMSRRVSESLLLPSVYSWVFGVFAAIGGIMAIAGIYGVISYSVSQRTQEIGIRVALGARPGDITRHVMRQGAILIVMGLSIGLPGAFALSRVLASFLFGVSAQDVTIFTGVSILLVAVATLACYVPARRAARVDPIAALRYE